MGELVEIVDSLENKVSKLLHKLELLQQGQCQVERRIEPCKGGEPITTERRNRMGGKV